MSETPIGDRSITTVLSAITNGDAPSADTPLENFTPSKETSAVTGTSSTLQASNQILPSYFQTLSKILLSLHTAFGAGSTDEDLFQSDQTDGAVSAV